MTLSANDKNLALQDKLNALEMLFLRYKDTEEESMDSEAPNWAELYNSIREDVIKANRMVQGDLG